MNVDEISRLIELLDKSSVAELQWKGEGESLLLKKQGLAPIAAVQSATRGEQRVPDRNFKAVQGRIQGFAQRNVPHVPPHGLRGGLTR